MPIAPANLRRWIPDRHEFADYPTDSVPSRRASLGPALAETLAGRVAFSGRDAMADRVHRRGPGRRRPAARFANRLPRSNRRIRAGASRLAVARFSVLHPAG